MEPEILSIVDQKDHVIGSEIRSAVEQQALMHRVARVIVKNSKHQLLIQKRTASKRMYPGHWDIGVAGCVQKNEAYETAALDVIRRCR